MPFPPLTKDSVFEYEAALKEHVRLCLNLTLECGNADSPD